MLHTLTLVSHTLCPYVQRAAIALTEKGIDFERINIDLANKPEWFLKVSPLGKTPVLLVNGQAIFESAAICEYLDDTVQPRLHPDDALERARHRGWMEFGSALLNTIGAFYNAPDETNLSARAADIRSKMGQIEAIVGAGPYFSGEHFSLVDAVFGPIFRYFDVIEKFEDFGFFEHTPRVKSWRRALAERPSVQTAVSALYSESLQIFLKTRNSALSRRITSRPTS